MFDFENALSDAQNGGLQFFIEERRPGLVVSRMPVTRDMLNPFGTIHAGAMIWLADVTATVLTLIDTTVSKSGRGFPLAINLNANLLGNQRDGEIRAEARFVRDGKRVRVVRTQLYGNSGKLLAEITTNHVPAG
jgi:1,4-dihydroxy-2-naphthoyl-CoA hydrolase